MIRAICFDLFTLFDPRSVIESARKLVPDSAVELCDTWRARQFEYAWLRVAAAQYLDFRAITDEALRYAADVHGVSLTPEMRETLVSAYSRLTPWPDTRQNLERWRAAGIRLAPLSNYSRRMVTELVENAGLRNLFDVLIPTESAQTFKPAPRAYALGESVLGLDRREIAFAAFGGWDAAGAKWFGFPTFWVNRLNVKPERLAPGPDGTGPTLNELAQFVTSWNSKR
jgi:2-haloacid dehalogenase